MKCMLMGLNNYDGIKTPTGNIDGVKLHWTNVDGNTFGHQANNQMVQRNVFNGFGLTVKEVMDLIGTEVNIEFNPKGKICGFSA